MSNYFIKKMNPENSVYHTPHNNTENTAFTPVSRTEETEFISDGLKFRKLNQKEAEVIGLTNATANAPSICIPAYTSNHFKVVRIAPSAFQNTIKLISITLPATVTEIGEYAFANSTLQNINVLDGIQRIGKFAFSNTQIKAVDMSKSALETMENGTFFNATHLRKVELPTRLKHIDDNVFTSCFALESIHLPHSVQTIGKRVFANCHSLHTFSSGELISIGTECFKECSALTNIPNPCDVLKDNVLLLLKDTALFQHAEYIRNCKTVLTTLVEAKPYSFLSISFHVPEVEVIASGAFQNFEVDSENFHIELPHTLKLIHEGALSHKETTKILDADGIVKSEKIEVPIRKLVFKGSIAEWLEIVKLGPRKNPVIVTCEEHIHHDGFTKSPFAQYGTFVDYL